jgi:eukaryotic-like serine/threonine-protein kinase
MTPESWQRVVSLFQAASDLPLDDQRAFLERECAGDTVVLTEVLNLLCHDSEADGQRVPDAASRQSGPVWSESGLATDPGNPASQPVRPVQVLASGASGSVPTAEFEGMLRERMHVSGWILLLGFSAFLVKDIVDGTYFETGRGAILCAHLAVLLTAALAIGVLRSPRALTLRTLRALEWAILGANTCFFSAYQLVDFQSASWASIAAEGHHTDVLDLTADSSVLRWFAFLVGYGLVIPNTWWRCARVVLGIALFPLAVILGVGCWEGTLGELREAFLEMTVRLGLALAVAVYGSHKIRQLTTEVNEARRFGQYELKRLLGSGGMGEVYLAEHALLKRPCAIKLIRPEKAGDAAALLRFEREVRATAKLKQPNVIEVYDYGRTDDGRFYYVMEYVSGPTLEELVARHGPLAFGRAVTLLRQLCNALHEAHNAGLVHRDLKPGNVIVTCQGGQYDLAKLLDFGLVQDLGAQPAHGRLTEVGLIIGTPAYMSPEQASGHSALDSRSDIYSLGCVGYFALSGRPVFEGRSIGQLIAAHLTQVPTDLALVRPDVPLDLAAVIHRCLAKDPADRFQDVAALERALGHCGCATDWSADDAAFWWRSRAEADDAARSSPVEETADELDRG